MHVSDVTKDEWDAKQSLCNRRVNQTIGKLKAVRTIIAICLKAVVTNIVEVKPDRNWRMGQVKFRRLKSRKHAQLWNKLWIKTENENNTLRTMIYSLSSSLLTLRDMDYKLHYLDLGG